MAVNDEDGQSVDILEGFSECLEDLLQTFDWALRGQNLANVHVDLLDSIDIDLVGWTGLLIVERRE